MGKLYGMVGYKLFKENEDGSVHMVRIVGMHRPFKLTSSTKDPAEIKILDYDTMQTKKVRVDTLQEYHPLTPDGILTGSVVTMQDKAGNVSKDVIISGAKQLDLKINPKAMPFCACRQSITDIFNNLQIRQESDMLVGLSVNQNDCPANFEYKMMFMQSGVEFFEVINFYRTDVLEDIYPMMDMKKYDAVLENLYMEHINSIGKPELQFKREHGGWCKNLKTLLEQNNFQTDLNEMLGITQVDFTLSQYFEERESEDKKFVYNVLNDEARMWLSLTYAINIKEATVLEFDHDINLADFNDNKYFLIRDNKNILYLITYITEGEFYEEDLVQKAKELDFSTKFKLKFYNKYTPDNSL